MVKLNAGISRKVGLHDYGSRGASVNVEMEVESGLASDSNALLDYIRRLFAMARDAVDEELAQTSPSHECGVADRANAPARNGNGRTPRSSTSRPVTSSQLNAIRSIAAGLNTDPEAVSHEAFGVGLNQLTLRQASDLIDRLKSQAGSRR